MFVIIIQPGFANADHFGVAGFRQKRSSILEQFLFRLVRMHANAAPDIGESLRHGAHAWETRQLGADTEACPDTCGLGPRHHIADAAGIVGKIEMAMAVDQHGAHNDPARDAVAAISRAALRIVWRGSRLRPRERAKLSSSRSNSSVQRCRCRPDWRALRRMRVASASTRKSPKRGRPSFMRESRSPSAKSAMVSGVAA